VSDDRWLGIDFSGNHLKWRPGCGTSNVWIADVRRNRSGLHLHDVRRVQQLVGTGDPFDHRDSVRRAIHFGAGGAGATRLRFRPPGYM
jgi:hypothetical protein